MKTKAIFYHAGCPVCLEAESEFATALNPDRYDTEIVHLGNEKDKLPEAERNGVQSVPALVINGKPYQINFGASLSDLKN